MFSHMMVGSDDIERSRAFYDPLFAAIGSKPAVTDMNGRLRYVRRGAMFLVTRPLDGQPATPGNGMTVGFAVDGPEQADAWHAAGLANGGTAIESPPGVRTIGEWQVYLAYLRDPDGNKLCAMHSMG